MIEPVMTRLVQYGSTLAELWVLQQVVVGGALAGVRGMRGRTRHDDVVINPRNGEIEMRSFRHDIADIDAKESVIQQLMCARGTVST